MKLNKRLLNILNEIENNCGQWDRKKRKFTIYLHSQYPEEWKDWHNAEKIHNALFSLPEVRKSTINKDFDKVCGRVFLTFEIN